MPLVSTSNINDRHGRNIVEVTKHAYNPFKLFIDTTTTVEIIIILIEIYNLCSMMACIIFKIHVFKSPLPYLSLGIIWEREREREQTSASICFILKYIVNRQNNDIDSYNVLLFHSMNIVYTFLQLFPIGLFVGSLDKVVYAPLLTLWARWPLFKAKDWYC